MESPAFVVGLEHGPQFNAVYEEAFGAHRPARSIVIVPRLPNDYLVEIEAIALVRGGPRSHFETQGE